MATLVLTAAGTALGGPLGGAIGALVGRQIDFAAFGGGQRSGARLADLSVQTSSYGTPIPQHFGKVRRAGSVIWSTDLVEHSQQSGGKGRPTVTSYGYSVSFAVVLSSRPITDVGRIWADGNLLRGASGDLKVGGLLRIYNGYGDQAPDPLILQTETAQRCPAYRNFAYAVFEGLDLTNFGNRIPSLTFEIIADDHQITIGDVVTALGPETLSVELDHDVIGYSVERGTINDALETLGQAFPLSCSVSGNSIVVAPAEKASAPPAVLAPPAAGGPKADSVQVTGWNRSRNALPLTVQCGIRYYDIDRDYQPGIQQSIGRSAQGNLAVIEFPASLTAVAARVLAQAASRRQSLPRDTIRYRLTEIDPAIGPGSIVRLPIADGYWRVDEWELQADGVLLLLTALPIGVGGTAVTEPGRSFAAADLANSPTILAAFELPWDGSGNDNTSLVYCAASSFSAGWSGAALFAERPGGALMPLGGSGRRRAVLGTVAEPLPRASPHFIDRLSAMEVKLAGAGLDLAACDFFGLAAGANQALVGNELIQFGSVSWIAPDTVVLRDLLRGRGGTEAAIGSHLPGETFVLVDRLVAIDPALVGDASNVQIVAVGAGDAHPAKSAISARGSTTRPLFPVHGQAGRLSDGSLQLTWIRRARGSYQWLDSVDVAINEETEAYDVQAASMTGEPLHWRVDKPSIVFEPELADRLISNAVSFSVSQIGRAAISSSLTIDLPA